MARDVESLVVSLSADIKRFERELRRANGVADKQMRDIERRHKQAADTVSPTRYQSRNVGARFLSTA